MRGDSLSAHTLLYMIENLNGQKTNIVLRLWLLIIVFFSRRIDSRGEEALTISGFYCHGENLFVQFETTAPPPRKKNLKKRGIR